MATLSGQTIQSTYQGLLKLANSTTGITNSIQAIEDGLGNDTGLEIKNNFLTQLNQINIGRLKNDFFGVGISIGSGSNPAAGQNNIIGAYPFYDAGIYQYSAITFNLVSASTTNDTYECAFYTCEMGPDGLYAKDVIISGITASTVTPTGNKTYVFPNYISFSATPAVNFFLQKITSSGSTRTFNFSGPFISLLNSQHLWTAYGFTDDFRNPGALSIGFKSINGRALYSGLTSFNTSYIPTDFSGVSTATLYDFGFVLHTVK